MRGKNVQFCYEVPLTRPAKDELLKISLFSPTSALTVLNLATELAKKHRRKSIGKGEIKQAARRLKVDGWGIRTHFLRNSKKKARKQTITSFAKQVRKQLQDGYGIRILGTVTTITDLHKKKLAKFVFGDSELWFRYAPDGGVAVDLIKEGRSAGYVDVDPPICHLRTSDMIVHAFRNSVDGLWPMAAHNFGLYQQLNPFGELKGAYFVVDTDTERNVLEVFSTHPDGDEARDALCDMIYRGAADPDYIMLIGPNGRFLSWVCR